MSIFSDFVKGYIDSLKIFKTPITILSNTKIKNNIFNCLVFNGLIFLGSIFLYTKFLAPNNLEYSLANIILRFFYYLFIIIPIFLMCNVLSTFWIDEIYFESLLIFEKRTDIKVEGQNFLVIIANQVERIFIIVGFSIQNLIFSFIPFSWLSFLLIFISLTILHSIYVFEYILLQKYIKDFTNILIFIESRLYYFIGFGLNLTFVVYYMNSFITASAVYLIFFPFFLIASIEVAKDNFDSINIKPKKLYVLWFVNFLYENIFFKLLNFMATSTKNKKEFKKERKNNLELQKSNSIDNNTIPK